MTKYLQYILKGLAVFIAFPIFSFGSGEVKSEEDFIGMEPVEDIRILALVPLALLNSAIQNPRVLAKVQVSSEGIVEDLVILEASHSGLVPRAERLIRETKFDIPNSVGGESIRFELKLPFVYPSDLGMNNQSSMDHVEGKINELRVGAEELKYYSAKILDDPLRVLKHGPIYSAENGAGERLKGEAIIEFYINHRGEVRLPRVISSDGVEIASAAIETFVQLTFNTPQVEGRAAVTKIRMPFSLN